MKEGISDRETLVSYGRVLQHFGVNIQRIGLLLKIAQSHMTQTQALEVGFDEILRAIVVFLHASLEDTLREIVRLRLRSYSTERLNDIPLAGMDRGQKFTLEDLNKHRGKTVDDLIQESIDQFLNNQSFSSTNNIVSIFEKKLGISLSYANKHFTSLDQMISRRHQIVHRADLENSSGSRNPVPISFSDIARWLGTVVAFVIELYPNITDSSDLQEQIRNLPEIKEMQDIGQQILKISNIPIDMPIESEFLHPKS